MRLLVSVLLVALWLPLSAQSKVLGEIPFQFHDGLIWLKVGVAGKRAAKLSIGFGRWC